MRLLQSKSHGCFSQSEFTSLEVPRYAILSHTWGADGEEVTFDDLKDVKDKSKAGYKKLRFCAEQAANDGLQYFWVDTCCIDKSKPIELQHAINSMFRWYQNAARCYVYLSDVHNTEDDQFSQASWEAAFRTSRWFTRGWTLQELIAPKSVDFFSKQRIRIGDRKSLEKPIHEITGIPVSALQGGPLSRFTVDERISWIENRNTQYEEDKVYSLQGIFDVHIPLMYGEGRDRALIRLQEAIDKSQSFFSQLRSNMSLILIYALLFATISNICLYTPEQWGIMNWSTQYPTKTLGSLVASKGDAPFIVPFDRNPHFTGREPQLAEIEEKLSERGKTTKMAITGLGGVGKTQLLLELVYRVRDTYKNCSIIWIPATNIESLEQAYLGVAQQLNIAGWEEDKANIKRLVQSYLSKESAGEWLLVFDNADNIDMWTAKPAREGESGHLIEYLPRNEHGCIIFTTRDRKTAVKLAKKNIIKVPEMDEDIATNLLQKCLADPELINNKLDTNALLKELTYLPLAIIQAVAYINENRITFSDYLSLLAEQEEDVIDLLSEGFEEDRRYQDVKNPVATTWLISFEQIRQRDSLAADYLSFMACIDSKDIPQSLLLKGQSRKKETDAIGTLDAYSFIIKRSADRALDLHRLVHLATRNWLRKQELIVQWTEKAITQLEEVFPDNDHANRSVWRTYLPHVRYALISNVVDKDRANRMKLVWRFGLSLLSDGRYDEAEVQFIEALEANRRVLGQEHPETLTSIANLAATYRNQGRWKEAEDLFVLVIETRKRVLGEEHPDTLSSIANLAATYRNQGRWEEAEDLFVLVMETRKRVLGEEHPDTLSSIANLAATFWNQGRWKEAEDLFVLVIETMKRVLGEEHPDTLSSIANLAATYRNQGRWKEAEDLFVLVVEMMKRVLGEEHPDTLSSIANLAATFWNQGRWKEAEDLEALVMETRKRVLGEEHPDTLSSIANLAATYRNQGRWKEAEDLFVLVMETRKRVLGPEHPSTLISMNNLAFTWKGQGKAKEALALMEECVRYQTSRLGLDHPYTQSSLGTLNQWREEGIH